MKTEIWTIRKESTARRIRVIGATMNIWNVVNVPISKSVAAKIGNLEGWRAGLNNSPRIAFVVR